MAVSLLSQYRGVVILNPETGAPQDIVGALTAIALVNIATADLATAYVFADEDPPEDATRLLLVVEGAPVRWSTVDGTLASASVGTFADVGTVLEFNEFDIAGLSIIRLADGAALSGVYEG